VKPVTRHPCTGWETDSLGESSTKTFGPDVALTADEAAPGGSSEGDSSLDSAVATTQTLYFLSRSIETTAHDEWTVDGQRWEQQGEGAIWALGTVVNLGRRTG